MKLRGQLKRLLVDHRFPGRLLLLRQLLPTRNFQRSLPVMYHLPDEAKHLVVGLKPSNLRCPEMRAPAAIPLQNGGLANLLAAMDLRPISLCLGSLIQFVADPSQA